MSLERSWDFHVEESQLLRNWEMLNNEILKYGLHHKAKNWNMEDALAYFAILKLFNLVEGVVAMQVVHAMEDDRPLGLLWEVCKALCQQWIIGNVLEGPKEVVLAVQ